MNSDEKASITPRNERGAAIAEFLLTAPVIIVVVFGLLIQGALWFQGREFAQAAAMQGALAAAAMNGDSADADAVSADFLRGSSLNNTKVATTITPTTVQVDVSGDVLVLVPGLRWSTTQRATVGREVLTTP